MLLMAKANVPPWAVALRGKTAGTAMRLFLIEVMTCCDCYDSNIDNGKRWLFKAHPVVDNNHPRGLPVKSLSPRPRTRRFTRCLVHRGITSHLPRLSSGDYSLAFKALHNLDLKSFSDSSPSTSAPLPDELFTLQDPTQTSHSLRRLLE